jgi:hypothetical protein
MNRGAYWDVQVMAKRTRATGAVEGNSRHLSPQEH